MAQQGRRPGDGGGARNGQRPHETGPSGADRRRDDGGSSAADRRAQRRASKDAAEAKARRECQKAKAQARQTGRPGPEVPRPHEPQLAVRPFSSVDFSQVVELMPPEWLFAGMSEAEVEAQARRDIAGALAESTVALVATVDDGTGYDPVTVGFLIARVEGQPPLRGAGVWREAADDAEKTLRYGCPQARLACTYEQQLSERGALALAAAGDARGADNELILFAVAPDVRGSGAGAALVAAFERALREAGAPSYWLQTDTTCSWQWYEAHGYERCADVELGPEYPMPPGDAARNELDPDATASLVPEDAAEPSTPHRVMLYRKDL